MLCMSRAPPPPLTSKACATTRGMSPRLVACPAHLTWPATAASWSHSWKAPLPTSLCAGGKRGARGERSRGGEGEEEGQSARREARRRPAGAGTPPHACPDSPHLLAAAADHDQWPAVDLSVAEARDAVHHPWAADGQQHTGHAGEEAGGGGGVPRCLLVAAGNEADATRLRGCRVASGHTGEGAGPLWCTASRPRHTEARARAACLWPASGRRPVCPHLMPAE